MLPWGVGSRFLEERGHYSCSTEQIGSVEGAGPGVPPLPACPRGPARACTTAWLAGWLALPWEPQEVPLVPPLTFDPLGLLQTRIPGSCPLFYLLFLAISL